jgi:hypothetical protein
MADETRLQTLTRSVVEGVERNVDVERELEAFRRRLATRPPTRDRVRGLRTVVGVAAGALLVTGFGALALLRHDDSDRISTSSSRSVVSNPDTSPIDTTIIRSVPATLPPVTMPPVILPPVTERTFRSEGSVDGVVTISSDTAIQPALFRQTALVPFDTGDGFELHRHTTSTFWVSNIGSGAVVLFDLNGQISGTTHVPTALNGNGLRSIAVGPNDTVYALYAMNAVTIAAYTMSEPAELIKTWIFDDATQCAEYCYLEPAADGFAWAADVVPYVDASGNAIGEPARPIDPVFVTDWENLGGMADVDVRGPIADGATPGQPSWSLRIERVVFNSDLYRSFLREVDGSYTTIVVRDHPPVPELYRQVLLWLRDHGEVAAIDVSTVDGLSHAVVTANGTLIGLVRTDEGVVIGNLEPPDTSVCDVALIRRDLGTPSAEIWDGRCDGTWSVVTMDPADAENSLAVARHAEGDWSMVATIPTQSLCAADLAERGAPPVLVVGGVDWPCESFVRDAIEYRSEADTGPMLVGHEGPRVRALQLELVRLEYLTTGDVDGSFGGVTRNAVIDYQLAAELLVTGSADTETLRQLRLLPEERTSTIRLVATGTSLGDAEIGQPAESVIAYLTDVLGPPDRDDRPVITFPVFSSCTDWEPRILAWSNLEVTFARWDLNTDQPVGDPRLFTFALFDGVSTLVDSITTANGARVGDPLSRWTELHPDAEVDLTGPGDDPFRPLLALVDGLNGSMDRNDDDRITSLWTGPFLCQD